MNERQTHPSIEELADLIEGRLVPEDVQRVEAHLAAGCPTCAAELAWLQETLALMTSDDWVAPPPAVRATVRRAFRQRYQRSAFPATLRERLWALFTPVPRWAATAVLFLMLFIAGGLLLRTWRTTVMPETAALLDLTGQVEIVLPGSASGQPATVGQEIPPEAQLRTGPASRAVLAFPDGSETRLEAGTELVILQLRFDRRGERYVALRQRIGRTHNRVQDLPPSRARFEIQTPAATIVVRGTEFLVDVAPGGLTHVTVVAGTVEVTAQGITVRVAANAETTVRPGEPPAVPVPRATPTAFPAVPPSPAGTSAPATPVTLPETPSPQATSVPELPATPPTIETLEATALITPTETTPPTGPQPTETPAPPHVPGPRPTQEPTREPQATSTPRPTESPEPTWSPEPTGSPRPTGTPEPTATTLALGFR